MQSKDQDTWVEGEFVNEVLSHTFGKNNVIFTFSQGNYEGGLHCIEVYPDKKTYLAEYDKGYDVKRRDKEHVVPAGDHDDYGEKEARKLVADAIKRFDKIKDARIEDIDAYLASRVATMRRAEEQKNAEKREQKFTKQDIELAKRMGYTQGVCEAVIAIDHERAMGKKLLSKMNVTKEMAQKYAKPETFKTMEQGIFSQKAEQKLEHKHSRSL